MAFTSISTVLKTRPNWLVQSDEPRIGQVKIGKIGKKSRTNPFSSSLIPIFKTMNIFNKDVKDSNFPSPIVTIKLFKKKKNCYLLKYEGFSFVTFKIIRFNLLNFKTLLHYRVEFVTLHELLRLNIMCS